jgi:hypothetical protein
VCAPASANPAAKSKSSQTRKGSKWLRGTLTESAKGVVRPKGTYLSARYHRIKSRRGHAKATIATAHKILTAAYQRFGKPNFMSWWEVAAEKLATYASALRRTR